MRRETLAAILMMIGGFLLLADARPPGPNPVDPVNPVDPIDVTPIDVPGNRMLIVYESGERSKYPAEQSLILNSGVLAEYLDETCTKASDGHPEWRIWDKDVKLSDVDGPLVEQVWVDAMKLPRDSLPWLIVTNGTTGFSGALPQSEAETMQLLRKYFK
jgi:hypothetical protein